MIEHLFFASEKHQARFVEAMKCIGKVYHGKLDPEYAAAVYVLTADLATWQKAHGYVSREGIDLPTLLEDVDFSGGYTVLLHWAGNLFNGMLHVDPLELMGLDERLFLVAVTALMIRRYSVIADILSSRSSHPVVGGAS